jgi:hypothetical protein
LLAGVVAGVERDGLNRLRWFEVAGVALHIRHLLGEALQVGDEGLGFGEGLSVLHALHVAFVRVSVRGSDGDVGQLGALLRKSSDVLPQGFPWLLALASEIPGVPRAHIRALEVSSEGFDQVIPVGDLRRRQMLQPGSSGVGEQQGEVADDEVVIIRST